MLDREQQKAIAIGAAVLSKIKDQAAREMAIRNALTIAMEESLAFVGEPCPHCSEEHSFVCDYCDDTGRVYRAALNAKGAADV